MLLDAYEQFEAAEVCYRRAAMLDPSAFSWTYNLATVELQQGEYEQEILSAAENERKASDLSPEAFAVLWYLKKEGLPGAEAVAHARGGAQLTTRRRVAEEAA